MCGALRADVSSGRLGFERALTGARTCGSLGSARFAEGVR